MCVTHGQMNTISYYFVVVHLESSGVLVIKV